MLKQHKVLQDQSGEEGLELWRKGGIDLVLTDLKMPGMGGLGLIAEIRKEGPDVKVIVISGTLPEGGVPDANEALEKPFKIDVLLSTVQRVLES